MRKNLCHFYVQCNNIRSAKQGFDIWFIIRVMDYDLYVLTHICGGWMSFGSLCHLCELVTLCNIHVHNACLKNSDFYRSNYIQVEVSAQAFLKVTKIFFISGCICVYKECNVAGDNCNVYCASQKNHMNLLPSFNTYPCCLHH